MARSGVQGWSLSPARLGTQSSSGAARPPRSPSNPVSLCLPLIGFNERFNNTALPDQIKLLLSTELNPGSLLCNASMSQDPPFCRIPPASFAGSCLTHSLPPPPPCCPFLLTSAPSNPEQAEKNPPLVQKLHQHNSHKTGRIWRRMFLAVGCC